MELKEQKDVLKLVITKAWEDTLFKKRLIADPIKAIEVLTDAKVVLPEDKELIFTDQSDKNKVFVNIPAEPDVEDAELSEAQLENIAGGAKVTNDFIEYLSTTIIPYIQL